MALMAGMLVSSGSVVHAGLFDFLAPKASWQNCNVNSCSVGGSTSVTSSYAKTKYPILLAHGMAGFSAVGPLQYWNGITEDLVGNGANVFVAQQASLIHQKFVENNYYFKLNKCWRLQVLKKLT
jgi:triacylglycerol lipase